MLQIKSIAILIVTYLSFYTCQSNSASSSNSVAATTEQATSTEAEVKIGTQTWSTKNLDVSTFRNGDTIPEARTNEEWQKAGIDGKPAWCYYNNDPENGKKYGKLYNWYAVNDPRGLAPKGWHVPTDAEWTILTDYLRGKETAGTKMKSTYGWNDYEGKSGNGTNESGFAGSPGGGRNSGGVFSFIGRFAIWWSASENGTDNAWRCGLSCSRGSIGRADDGKGYGLSVRCLRD